MTSDITYATNNELGFDYLRDNMKYSRDQMVQRPFNFAIVDEVDSILIDEARTPLIISGPTDDKSDLYIAVDKIVKTLTEADYEKDEKQKSVVLTEDGTEKAERVLEAEGLIEGRNLYDIANTQVVHHLNQALKANIDVQEGHRLHRQGREGRHHRRVHRPDDGWAALVGRASPGGRGQGRRDDRAGEPDARLDHLPELLPNVPEAFGNDRHGDDRGAGILRHLQDERGRDPDQRGGPAQRRGRRLLQDDDREVRRHRRGAQGKAGAWPAGAGRHRVDRKVGDAVRISREGRRQAFGSQCPLPRAGGAYRRPGGTDRRGHHRHQHGRPRHRHPARRQPRVPDAGRVSRARAGTPEYEAQAETGPRRNHRREGAGAGARRALRARHRAPREPAHRQPAARPLGPPGRPRPVEILPQPRRRSAAHLRPADDVLAADEQEPRGRRSDRLPVDLARPSRPRRRRSRRATTTSASRSSNSTT